MNTNYLKQIETIKQQIQMVINENDGSKCEYTIEDDMVLVNGIDANGESVFEDIIDMEEFNLILRANGKVMYESGAFNKITKGIMEINDMFSFVTSAMEDPTSTVVMDDGKVIVETNRYGETSGSVYSW